MSQLSSPDRPRIFAIRPGADFAAVFVRGLMERLKDAPADRLARTEIFTGTRRAARALEAAMTGAESGFLPRIRLIPDLGSDPLLAPETPLPVPSMRRRLYVTRLVERYLETAGNHHPPPAAAPALADALIALLDELQEEEVDPARLDELVSDASASASLAAHWQETLAFADLVRRAWPEIRAEVERGAPDPAERQLLAIDDLVARWRAAPPEHPVIVAGSTGSRAPTARLMLAVAALAEGAVVLPGFDPGVEPAVWAAAGVDHPLGPFRRFFGNLGIAPADVRLWSPDDRAAARGVLLEQALRPAPVTDAWTTAAPGLGALAEAATQGVTMIEAPTQRHEAAAIALAIRRAVESPGKRIALVTPDATLARRVAVELGRFGIEPDDSLGRPLTQTPAGIFLRLVARLAAAPPDPVTVAALLQHPFTAAGLDRATHLAHARRYEIEVLRGRPVGGAGRAGGLPVWAGAEGAAQDWLDGIQAALSALARPLGAGAGLDACVAGHLAAATRLSATPEDPERLWRGRDGIALAELFSGLGRAADAHGDASVVNYPGLIDRLLDGETLRIEVERHHPRVMIWGTLEARMQAADLMILGGLNEGVWPAAPAADPWLSRPMRAALGLIAPERLIGLAAHDFLQAASHAEVILTRSEKLDGTPQVASRWLLRLENLLSGLGETGERALAAMRARGTGLLELIPLIHQPEHAQPPAARPMPRPDPLVRPRRLSVTQIETLIRDAYAIYASKVLGLKPLDPLGRAPDYLTRGTVMHTMLERFVGETRTAMPNSEEAAAAHLMRLADDVLAEEVPWPEARRVWRGRIARFATWFVRGEIKRRASARPEGLEVKGHMTLIDGPDPVEVSARADRIDVGTDGSAVVYDYKTGAPPTGKQIEKGFAQQLHVQAAILLAGGFEDLGAMPADRGAYLGLTGTGEGGKETHVTDLPSSVEQHISQLRALLEAYLLSDAPFVARSRPFKDDEEGDYDHLARRGEWEGREPS